MNDHKPKQNRLQIAAVILTQAALLLNAPGAPAALAQTAKPPKPQPAANQPAKTGKLIVKVNGFRNTKGHAIALLYADKKSLEAEKHMRAAGGEIEAGVATLVFENLPAGTYAIFAFHDENKNEDLDLDWLSVPKEGIGTSNNHNLDREPRFEEIAINFEGEEKSVAIKLKYW